MYGARMGPGPREPGHVARSRTPSGPAQPVSHDRHGDPMLVPGQRRFAPARTALPPPVARVLAQSPVGNGSDRARHEWGASANLDGRADHGSTGPASGSELAGP